MSHLERARKLFTEAALKGDARAVRALSTLAASSGEKPVDEDNNPYPPKRGAAADDADEKPLEEAKRKLQEVVEDPGSSEEERRKAKELLWQLRDNQPDDEEDKDKDKKPVGYSPRLTESEKAIFAKLDGRPRSERHASQKGSAFTMPGHTSQADAERRAKELEGQIRGGRS